MSLFTYFVEEQLAANSLTYSVLTHIYRYVPGQGYGLHHDAVYFQRQATVLIYLNDVGEGGETVFPRAGVDSMDESQAEEMPKLEKVCASVSRGIFVTPQQGTSVLWHNLVEGAVVEQGEEQADRECDRQALHGSCPVTSGEKWVMQFWIRSSIFSDPGREWI